MSLKILCCFVSLVVLYVVSGFVVCISDVSVRLVSVFCGFRVFGCVSFNRLPCFLILCHCICYYCCFKSVDLTLL